MEAHFAVALALLRADAVYLTMVAPARFTGSDKNAAMLGLFAMQNSAGMVGVTGSMLFIALSQTVIATWGGENTGITLTDAATDSAIAGLNLPLLKGLRNAVFHPGRNRDPREKAFADAAASEIPVISNALAKMRAYLRGYFAALRETGDEP